MTGSDWSVREIADAVATRRISATEILAEALTRIDRCNKELCLVVTIDERARRWAREADDAVLRGESLGPLHGVPLTVKDSFSTQGLRTTAGSRALAANIPGRDADAVAALRAAGGIVFAKTNLAENCGDLQSANPLFGAAANPWDPRYTTGGSSGGSAGAVAARFCAADLGSDIAGSIRIPAAACGVYGHRPSYGIVPIRGHHPPYQPIEPDLAVAGPLASTPGDLSVLLDLLVGPSQADRPAWRVELPPARTVRRAAIWPDDPYCPVDAEIRAALEDVAGVLEADGVPVEQTRPSGIRLDESDQVGRRLLASVALQDYSAADIAAINSAERVPGDGLGAQYVAQSYRDWMQAHARRERLRARWQSFFTHFDALLLPVVPSLVGPHDTRPFAERTLTVDGAPRPYWDQMVWANLTGLAGLPTTVVPVCRDSRGLPIGIAVVGPYLEDRTPLSLAQRLYELLEPLGPPWVRYGNAASSVGRAPGVSRDRVTTSDSSQVNPLPRM
ncbi:amidase [Actinoplanes italicus]|uniref:Amidase n=1 Tax=Actinoplanes italicus TaxID=113567 RepID=A0A2T0K7U4_9ACTN|nr:amidase family protein [Actinoplanes italicus]PRX19093.1 amidase [Actinoplanes italicus]GIE32330.1 amidase [Actinoplanes italicus]